jgi:hypothetical protein
MLRFIIGFALIGFAVAVLVGVLVSGASMPPIKQLMTTVYCQPGETIVQQSSRMYGNTYNITFACQTAQETRRDVTGPVTMSLIGVFVTLLFLGITFIISGAKGMVRRRIQSAFGSTGGFGQPFSNASRTVITLDGRTVQPTDLTSRLKQLEEARSAGLITEDEFARLRQEILDSLA